MDTENRSRVSPTFTRDGLAVYLLGEGAPILLMPYPHGYPLSSMAEHPLARILLRLGRSVVTFDPPGAFCSSRPARVDLPEMLECAKESLDACGLEQPIDILGHSMGGLCALAYTLENPQRVRRLVLVGSVSGGRASQRARGFPQNMSFLSVNFWRAAWWGMRLAQGWGNLAIHKQMLRLLTQISYHNPALAPEIHISPDDSRRPAPARDRWPMEALRIDLGPRLGEVRAPTLICVGRYDPQAPVPCSVELAQGIPGARLVVFQQSGHYPFTEEKDAFTDEARAFLK